MQDDRPGLFRDSQCHGVAEATVAVAKENTQGVAADIGRHEIRPAVPINISRNDVGRILADRIGVVKIEQVRDLMGLPLATSDTGEENHARQELHHV